jgi:dCMP deaminase
MEQSTEDRAHLAAAKIYAGELSRCKRLQVCCLFVKGRNILARGINGMPSGGDNQCEDEHGDSKPEVQHAEDNAILHAAKSGIALEGSTVYLTHAPCLRCASKLAALGVVRVVFGEIYRCTKGVDYLRQMGIEVCYLS